MRIAERMKQFDAYLGTEMNMRLTRMREEGRDVINLGLGDPDVTPPPHLKREAGGAAGRTIITRASTRQPLEGSHRRLVPAAIRG